MDALSPNLQLAIAGIIGYLFGSVPWGLVLMKLAGKGDIRTMGSGNIGATNVARNAGKPLGALTLILDASKGAIAALIFMQFNELAGIIAGFTAVLGHNFSIWLKFKGGKGIATTCGALLALMPIAALICIVTWLIVLALSRYVSIASLAAAVAVPISAWATNRSSLMIAVAFILGTLAIFKHKDNIRRLIAGTEQRIGKKKP